MGLLDDFNEEQKKEIFREAGNASCISPEGIAHAIRNYFASLQSQVEVARAFYFGRLEEALGGLLELPEDIRKNIDDLIWIASGEKAIDPTLPESQGLIASAVICSLEQRMGLCS